MRTKHWQNRKAFKKQGNTSSDLPNEVWNCLSIVAEGIESEKPNQGRVAVLMRELKNRCVVILKEQEINLEPY